MTMTTMRMTTDGCPRVSGATAITVLAALAFTLVTTTTASAQAQQRSVSEIITFLVTNQSVSTGNFERDRAAAQGTSDTIGRALLAGLARLPVSSSSTAFVYRLNPELGTVERATASFGPLFTERALTAGRGTASVGFTIQHVRFDRLDGRSLRAGTLVTTANRFTDEATAFDEDRLTLALDADVATLYGTVGITDRLEIGAAAPLVSLRIDGSRINTYRGRTFTQASASATAIGLADLLVRSKVSLYADGGAGLALAGEVRLPTGRREDLLGTGQVGWRVAAIGSLERGRLSSHANAGVATGGLAREVNGAFALALVAGTRTTLLGEVQARRVALPGHITTVTAIHPTLRDVETLRLVPSGSALTTLTIAPGVKWNLGGSWVVVSNVTFPLLRQGLTSSITPFVGIDWAAGR